VIRVELSRSADISPNLQILKYTKNAHKIFISIRSWTPQPHRLHRFEWVTDLERINEAVVACRQAASRHLLGWIN